MNAFGNYINGEFVDSKSGKTFPNINPANIDEVVGTFQASNEADVADACEAAVAATGGSLMKRIHRLLYPNEKNGSWTPLFAGVVLIATAAAMLGAQHAKMTRNDKACALKRFISSVGTGLRSWFFGSQDVPRAGEPRR